MKLFLYGEICWAEETKKCMQIGFSFWALYWIQWLNNTSTIADLNSERRLNTKIMDQKSNFPSIWTFKEKAVKPPINISDHPFEKAFGFDGHFEILSDFDGWGKTLESHRQ